MRKYLNQLKKFLYLRLAPQKVEHRSIANFEELNKQFLLENILTHQRYSEDINENPLWSNFIFNQKLGSIEFTHNERGYALALDKESVFQALAMNKLNNKLSIYAKVFPDGSININLSSVEFNLSLPCYSIKRL
jgi:hypothetical protein